MLEILSQIDFDKKVTRKKFIHGLGLAAGAISLYGCGIQPTPTQERKTNLTPLTKEKRSLPEITDREIKTIASRCIGDFNRVLGFNLPNETSEKTNLVNSLQQYQSIIGEQETDYVLTNEKNRPGITTDRTHSKGKQIFLFKDAISEMTKNFPNTVEAIKGREDILEWIINHELAHYATSNYESSVLHNLVFGRMFANQSFFKGKDIKPDLVFGAKIRAFADNRRVAGFQNLEETEAFIIGDYVTRQTKKQRLVSFPEPEELGIEKQVLLLTDLLKKLNPNSNEAIIMLALLRSQTGGREKFGTMIGGKLTKVETQSDQLFAGMSILYAIDMGDPKLYQQLTD